MLNTSRTKRAPPACQTDGALQFCLDPGLKPGCGNSRNDVPLHGVACVRSTIAGVGARSSIKFIDELVDLPVGFIPADSVGFLDLAGQLFALALHALQVII